MSEPVTGSTLRNIRILAGREFGTAKSNRWFLLFGLAFAGLSLAISWQATAGVGSYGLAGFGRTTAGLVNLILLIVPPIGLTLGALAIAPERERGSLSIMLSQPVTWLEVVVGKYLGLSVALLMALGAGLGLSGLVIAWRGGSAEIDAFLRLVAMTLLMGTVSLSLGLLVSALVRKGATAIGAVLFLWFLLTLGSDLALMGSAVMLNLGAEGLLVGALINPLQVFKIGALLSFRDNLEVLGPAGAYASETYGNALMPMVAGILAAWTIIPLIITRLITAKRGAL